MEKNEQKTPIVEQVILLGKEYKEKINKSKKMDKLLFFLIVANIVLLGFSLVLVEEINKVTIFLIAFSVLCFIVSCLLTRNMIKKAKKIPLKSLESFLTFEFPRIMVPLAKEDDPFLSLIKELFPNIENYKMKVLNRKSLDLIIEVGTFMAYNGSPFELEELLYKEISALSEENRKRYLKDLEELEMFFSKL